ncbi:hypothetical protein G9A89_021937 [Geosiphon pyriformis]|nr:hypothetical protein G9A89_021937 [Geosiphon pyriformis]
MTIKDILKKRVHPSTSNKFFTLVCRKWRPEDVFYSLSSIIPIQTFRYKVITNYQQINRKEQYLMRIRRRLRESIRYALPIVGKLRYDYLFIGREAVHDAEWKTLKDEVQRALGLSRLYDENVRNRRGGLSYSEFIEQVGYKNELDSSSQDGRKYKGKNSYSGREVNWEYLASEVGNIEEYMMGTNYFGQLDCNNIDRPYNGHQGDNLKKMYKREANDYNGMQSHELGPPPEWDD